jgi:hypothetical protein
MKISSVRLGHANNSSSTHSILLNSNLMPNRDCSDFQYGWEWFHLKGVEEKSKYLATLIYNSLNEAMADEHAGIIAKELTGYNPKEAAYDGYAYVDHQSVICFPKKYGEKKNFHHGFLKDFVGYVRNNPKISIRGGNDNSDDPGENAGQGTGPREWSPHKIKIGDPHAVNLIPRDSRDVPIYARKDGDWWILYNADGGAKIRLSFNDEAKEYLSSATPELCDLKITDYCPHGCEFCYQSSTKKGVHADMKQIQDVFYQMRQAEVFEVALGGGEPTLHPEFEAILESAALNGITPNFTTFNMAWAKDLKKAEAVRKWCRSFAVSSMADLDALIEWNEKEEHRGIQGTLQIPLGCYPEKDIRAALEVVKEKYMNVTFLGYKHFGRGEGFAEQPSDWILDAVSGPEGLHRFGADSVFIEQYGAKLAAAGVSTKLMVNREGAFSCYIDAVTMKMGASSYTKELHPMNEKEMFGKFPYVKVA